MRRRLTPDEEKQIAELWNSGWSVNKLARRFHRGNRTIDDVIVKQLGIERKTITARRDVETFSKRDTLCWICRKATGGCSWSRAGVPVAGWEAVECELRLNNNGLKTHCKSYRVESCPEFIKDTEVI